MTLRSARLWIFSFAAATALTIIGTTQDYASRIMENLPASWSRLLSLQAVDWYSWGLIAPFVFLLGGGIRGRGARSTALWAFAALGFTSLHSLLEVIVARSIGFVPLSMAFGTMVSARFAGTIVPSVVVFAAVALSGNAVRNVAERRARERRESDLNAALAKAQLAALRMQLQPHFLFNTLHTVSALMETDVAAARSVLAHLGDLLRLSLSHAEAQEMPLAEDLAFLQKYLDIERIRFHDRLDVRIDVAPGLEQVLVPSLVLQPHVENALRYAIAPRRDRGRLWLRAMRSGESVCLEVEDDGPGLTEGGAGQGNGVGIANTRARLGRLYGDGGRLELLRGSARGLLVRITLPYRLAGTRDG